MYKNGAIQCAKSLYNQVNILEKKLKKTFTEILGLDGRTDCHICSNCQTDWCGFLGILCNTLKCYQAMHETWAMMTAIAVCSCQVMLWQMQEQ